MISSLNPLLRQIANAPPLEPFQVEHTRCLLAFRCVVDRRCRRRRFRNARKRISSPPTTAADEVNKCSLQHPPPRSCSTVWMQDLRRRDQPGNARRIPHRLSRSMPPRGRSLLYPKPLTWSRSTGPDQRTYGWHPCHERRSCPITHPPNHAHAHAHAQRRQTAPRCSTSTHQYARAFPAADLRSCPAGHRSALWQVVGPSGHRSADGGEVPSGHRSVQRRIRESLKSPWWMTSPLRVMTVSSRVRTLMIAVTYWWAWSSARVMRLPNRSS